MGAWCGSSSSYPATASVVDAIEDDEKQKAFLELGEADPHLKPVKKKFSVRSCPFLWPVLVMRCFYPFERRPTDGDDVGDGEAKKQPFHLERHSTSTAGDFIADDEAKKKPLRQELGQAPSFQAHPLVAPVNRKCHVEYSEVSTSRYGFRSLFQWSFVTSCNHCLLCHRKSASGDDVHDYKTKLDHQKPNQATDDQLLSVISQNREDHVNDEVSVFGDQVGADSTEFIATAVQRSDGNVTLDVVESIAPSAEYPAESGVAAEEMITVLNLGGPGEAAEALGGLSLWGYKRIVFSVCPALPSDDTDFE